MLDEILSEVEMGRMNGPYQAPDWWTKPSVAPSKGKRRTLLPIPHSDPYIAMAFSIEQTGSDGNTKIRRGEDWRRSGHNATCTINKHFISCMVDISSPISHVSHCAFRRPTEAQAQRT